MDETCLVLESQPLLTHLKGNDIRYESLPPDDREITGQLNNTTDFINNSLFCTAGRLAIVLKSCDRKTDLLNPV
jgi:hypothetical protein